VQLIVAEKPAVARDIARVLGVRPVGQHAFEGGGRVITWCIGHLVELDEPASYDARWKAWRLDTLPMLPSEFRLRATKHAGAQRQAVARLLREPRFASVVNACDAGREGELIFRYVYQYARSRLPVQRLWISSLTDEAIRRGFAALAPGARYEPLADAARSRSEADWLVGMNATRAVTVRGRASGQTALWSIGRVQTPTLAMLVAREQAIRAFVPRPYWEVRGDFPGFAAWWRHGKHARLAAAALAGEVAERDGRERVAVVEKLRERTVREPPPLLFDLTSLQRTANRRFGLSAERTLEIAQALYERHKLITYPRTDARHLSSDLVGELPELLRGLETVPAYAPFASALLARQPLRPGKRIVDDAKVHDHHAIIPTGKSPRNLAGDEARIFDLIARRFLAAFYPDAELAVTEAWLRVGPATTPVPPFGDADDEIVEVLPPLPDRYLARGRVRRVVGWQEVIEIESKDELLPALVEGQELAGTYVPVAKHTKPPPRFTEATLLAAMESAGKQIDDEALRLAMKDCGLGTPATRAAIIETLLDRKYIAREKQQLVPTALGCALIAALPVASLASPELTGAWEARLAKVARGEDTRAAFMADIARFVADTVEAIRGAPAPDAPPSPPIGRCPRCGGSVSERHRDYGCACGFALPKRLAGRMLGSALAGVLLGKGRTQVLRGFRSKAGKKFSAALVLDGDGALKFAFDDSAAPAPPSPKPEALACPRCREGTLIAGARGWGCSRWRDGCRFVVWFETAGRRLTAKQLRDLVTRGKTRKATFAGGAGRLVLDPSVDGGAARFEPY